MAVVKELFQAYKENDLPMDNGYIVSAFFDGNSNYNRYEIISYANVKDFYVNEEGLVFQADGLKLFVLIEPVTYTNKHVEPCYRDEAHRVPYRFKEMNIYTTKRQDKIMIGKEPVVTYTNFTVVNSGMDNFSYIFHKTDDLVPVIENYFKESLRQDSKVPLSDARDSTKLIVESFEKILDPTRYF